MRGKGWNRGRSAEGRYSTVRGGIGWRYILDPFRPSSATAADSCMAAGACTVVSGDLFFLAPVALSPVAVFCWLLLP